MTGARCCVAVCRNGFMKTKQDEKTKHIRYHKFPKEPERVTIWMDRCNREKKCNPANSFICSEHFNEDDYERDLQSELLGLDKKKRLKKTALPTKLLTLQDLDDFLEEQVDKKLKAPYIPPQNKEIKIENVFSMNMHDSPSPPLTSIMEVGETYQEQKPVPLPIVVMLPYKTSSFDKQSQTIDVPIISTPIEPQSSLQNISNVTNSCTYNEFKMKYDNLNLKLKKIQKKTQLLDKRYSNLRHLFLKNKLRVKDLKREKAMNVLTIKRLSKEIKTRESEGNKKDEQISSCEAALKSVFSESQIKLLMGKKKVAWTTEDLSKAFTLLYYSKKTYLLLKHVLGMPLPSLSTLKRTAAKYNYNGKELEKDGTEFNSTQC